MIQKKIKLSDFPLLNKLLLNGKTILAYDKKNYYTELKNIKGDNIVDIEEIGANQNEGKRENLIKLKFDRRQKRPDERLVFLYIMVKMEKKEIKVIKENKD